MLGKLDWSAIPLDEPIPLIAAAVVLVAILAALIWAGKGPLSISVA